MGLRKKRIIRKGGGKVDYATSIETTKKWGGGGEHHTMELSWGTKHGGEGGGEGGKGTVGGGAFVARKSIGR